MSSFRAAKENTCLARLSRMSFIMENISLENVTSMSKTTFQKSSNAVKRVILGTFLITGFLAIILSGPFMIMLFFLLLQISIFNEILTIGYNYNKVPSSAGLPYFRSLNWYFLTVANYFFGVEALAPNFQDFYKQNYYLNLFVTYHRFISFCLYFTGIVMFLFNLVKKHDLKQFKILAWTHVLIIIIVIQSYLVMINIFFGIIWVILPIFLVIFNDIFAYIFGRLFGKTPLIKLSPKKTWEGFIGGVFGTLVAGLILSNFMCQFQYCVCPIEYVRTDSGLIGFELNTNCTRTYLFEPITYEINSFLSFNYYPFTVHFVAFALFASVIAPFGGFCASGFKRGVKIKDFGDVIPGHGGLTDRFDCQFPMATFINVYIFTFVNAPSVNTFFDKFLYLSEDSQLQFYYLLKDALESNGVLQNFTVGYQN